VGRNGCLCRAAIGSTGSAELASENDLGVDGDLPENVWPTARRLSGTSWTITNPARGQWRRTPTRDITVFGIAGGEGHQRDTRN
jgi:hypothetical protein